MDILHIRNNMLDGVRARAPIDLPHGQIALNYKSGYESLFMKNDTGGIVTLNDWSKILNKPSSLVALVIGTQTAATSSWTGVLDSVTELYDGLTINYWLPVAGVSSATLNLTLSGGVTTGAINLYYGGTSRLTTHYGAGNIIQLTYRINASINGISFTGWWAKANYDSSDNFTHRRYGVFKIGSTAIAANTIVGYDNDGLIVNALTTPFVFNQSILWCGTAYKANTASSNANMYEAHYSVSIAGTGIASLVLYKPIYLKGTIDGNMFTASSLTQTEPTSDDGCAYLLIGVPQTVTNTIQFFLKNWIYIYKDGALRLYAGHAESASKLTNTRVISLLGDAGGSVAFDGSKDVNLTVTNNALKSDTGQITDLLTLPSSVGAGYWSNSALNKPADYGTILDIKAPNVSWYNRLAFSTLGDIFYYTGINSANMSYCGKLAFTTSTVAAATKLANIRTIFGQNFDGTGNVMGNISGSWFAINDVVANPYLKLLENSNAWYLQGYQNKLYLGSGTSNSLNLDAAGNVGVVGVLTANRVNTVSESHMSVGAYADPASGIGAALKVTGNFAAGGNSYFSGGNVLINTLTDAGYKLDVNGASRIFGGLHLNSEGWLNLYNAANTSRISISHNSSASKVDIYNRTLNNWATVQCGNIETQTISMYNDQTERFIRSNVFGGAIRLRGNSAAATDRGIRFGRVDNSLNWLSQMAINADTGNVMINTITDAGYKLDVNGTGRFVSNLISNGYMSANGIVYAGGGLVSYNNASVSGTSYNLLTLNRQTDAGSSILFSNASANLGKIGFDAFGVLHIGNGTSTDGVGNMIQITSGGNLTAMGEITAYSASDRRLKTDIQQITSAMDVVDKLNPVSYKWNNVARKLNPNKTYDRDFGLIAQELEEVLPEMVHSIYGGEYKSVDYVKIVPFLIGAIKELKIEINKLNKNEN